MVSMHRVIALIIPRFEDVFLSFFATEIIKGASIAASRNKIDLLIHMAPRERIEDWQALVSLNPPHIDGVIISDIDGDSRNLERVIEKKIPYVVLNNYFTEPINCITIDNEKSAMHIIDYLVSLGHRDIATIAGALNIQAGISRLEGYKKGLAQHKIKLNKEYIKVGNFLRSQSREAMKDLLELKNRPSAVFIASDVMAMEAMDVIKTSGLSVPKDISIVGFDDNPLSIYSPIPLTTVSQPLQEMGRLGVEKLNLMIRKKLKGPIKETLHARLIKRASCQALTSN